MFLNGFVLREDPYARFCGQTGATAPSDPMRQFDVGKFSVYIGDATADQCACVCYLQTRLLGPQCLQRMQARGFDRRQHASGDADQQ